MLTQVYMHSWCPCARMCLGVSGCGARVALFLPDWWADTYAEKYSHPSTMTPKHPREPTTPSPYLSSERMQIALENLMVILLHLQVLRFACNILYCNSSVSLHLCIYYCALCKGLVAIQRLFTLTSLKLI